MAGRPTNATKAKNRNLANARRILLEAKKTPPAQTPLKSVTPESGEVDNESSGDDIECTGWTGGISHYVSSDDDPIIISDDDNDDDDDDDDEVKELSGRELEEEVPKHSQPLEIASQSTTKLDACSAIMRKQTEGDWRRAESCRSLGYNKQSGRTKRRHEQLAREKAKEDAELRKRWV